MLDILIISLFNCCTMLVCLSLSVVLLLFFYFSIFACFLFLEFVESQPALFLILFFHF